MPPLLVVARRHGPPRSAHRQRAPWRSCSQRSTSRRRVRPDLGLGRSVNGCRFFRPPGQANRKDRKLGRFARYRHVAAGHARSLQNRKAKPGPAVASSGNPLGPNPGTVWPAVSGHAAVNSRPQARPRRVRPQSCAPRTRKHGRYGHRDATRILVAYRHGLRASEVCDLQWQQIELSEGRLHVHRVKNGISSVHPR